MKPIDPSRIQRIMVRSANWVGDAIMTTPALHTLRRSFPHAHITLLAKPWVIPVFDNSADIDEVMTYQTDGRHKGYIGQWRLTRDLHQRRFDLAVLLQNAFEPALLSFMSGIPKRIGFTTDGRGLLLTHRVYNWRDLKKGHLIDYYLGLLDAVGLPIHDRKLRLTLSSDEKEKARTDLTDYGIAPDRAIVGFNPGATFGTAKRWPQDFFAQLGKKLKNELKAVILVFGAKAEEELGAAIAAEIGFDCLNLCGKTSLREAMAAIGLCRLFVTNDSGLMHVAAALEVPQIAIIGPTDPVATGPINTNSHVLRNESACPLMPCMKSHCPTDHRCMTVISVDEVFQAATTMLANQEVRL